MIRFIDERLKEWAQVQYINRDRAQGWSGQSPICRLGSVSSKVWDGDIAVLWRPTESDVSDIQVAVDALGDADRIVIAAYYIKCGCNKSAAARAANMARQTFADRLAVVHKKIERLLAMHNHIHSIGMKF